MIISMSIRVTENGITAFFFMTEDYSIVYLYHTEEVFLFAKTQELLQWAASFTPTQPTWPLHLEEGGKSSS